MKPPFRPSMKIARRKRVCGSSGAVIVRRAVLAYFAYHKEADPDPRNNKLYLVTFLKEVSYLLQIGGCTALPISGQRMAGAVVEPKAEGALNQMPLSPV